MATAKGQRDTTKYLVAMILSEAELDRYVKALDETDWMLAMADEVFGQLDNDLMENQPGAAAVCHLARIALHHKQQTDGETLSDLRIALRKAFDTAKDTNAKTGGNHADQS